MQTEQKKAQKANIARMQKTQLIHRKRISRECEESNRHKGCRKHEKTQ